MNSVSLSLIIILPLLGCLTKRPLKETHLNEETQFNAETRLNEGSSKKRETQPGGISIDAEKDTIIKEIKSEYSQLGSALSKSNTPESQDLAKLANAIAAEDEENIKTYLNSEHISDADSGLAKSDENTNDILKNNCTKYSVIALASLGAVALAGGLLTFKPMRIQSYASIGVGLASLIIGTKLISKDSKENRDQANSLIKSSGVIALILGLGAATTAFLSKSISEVKDVKFREQMLGPFKKISGDQINLARARGLNNYADLVARVKYEAHAEVLAKNLNEARLTKKFTADDVLRMDRVELKKFYNKRVKVLHPDRGGIKDEFVAFKEAYDSIKDAPTISYKTEFNKRIGIGAGIAALGVGLLYAHDKYFNLSESNEVEAENSHNLVKINHLIAKYKGEKQQDLNCQNNRPASDNNSQ